MNGSLGPGPNVTGRKWLPGSRTGCAPSGLIRRTDCGGGRRATSPSTLANHGFAHADTKDLTQLGLLSLRRPERLHPTRRLSHSSSIPAPPITISTWTPPVMKAREAEVQAVCSAGSKVALTEVAGDAHVDPR
jgi:hypothetical protein